MTAHKQNMSARPRRVRGSRWLEDGGAAEGDTTGDRQGRQARGRGGGEGSVQWRAGRVLGEMVWIWIRRMRLE